ncbi:hypothetical protein HUG17_5190 [Dermatophagoides farinae]|uniref:Exportin-1/Importin-beta-like domain-containing protein n=1 Tax=Dermatophagoides farinae TaxID=6954 RepID=A0A9D4SI60_DERFA|nr:uncharacterized protein LOC124493055 [Dermatophagoides farinae]KAH7642145.1 hypothetical protein HUG17_5190 [Dermatophagoides farinae]
MNSNPAIRIVEEIDNCIQIIMKPDASNDDRIKANSRLNDILTSDIYAKTDLYLNVAMLIVNRSEDMIITNEFCIESLVTYGYQILEEIIKNNWYNFDHDRRENIKTFCLTRFEFRSNIAMKVNLSTSNLFVNSCSRLITEIFMREWPNRWPQFLPKLTQEHSLISLYTILNISDYLTKLFLPYNSNRRREITKSLVSEKDNILEFLCRNLLIMNIQNEHQMSIEYRKQIILKSLEVLDSLLDWYPLNENILIKIILTANLSNLNFEDTFLSQVKILSLRCIQTIITRSIKRPEDMEVMNGIFFDIDQSKFAHFLISQLNPYFHLIKSSESNIDSLNQVFLLLLDISIEIVCRVMNLINQDSTHKSIVKSCNDNKSFWSTFMCFIFDCLAYDNIIYDEILLKFLILYSKSQLTSKQDINDMENLKNNSILPVPFQLETTIPIRLLISIALLKLEPKPESMKPELKNSCDLDSYESYLQIFRENKNKFLTVIRNLCQNYPQISQTFCFSMFSDLFGPIPLESFDPEVLTVSTNINSFNTAAVLCPLLILKKNFSQQQIKLLEFYFSRMLEIGLSGQLDIQSLNSLLSCLSSFSPFYGKFSVELIQKLIDIIFTLTVKTKELQYDPNIGDLQNHLNALFIKLTKNCVPLFLPYFKMMRQHIEELIVTDKISLIQSFFLYEGLFILSNHLSIEEQRSFLIDDFLSKINWIITYDFGPNGQTFFLDLGLATQPQFNVNHLPSNYSKILVKISALSNLLTRLFKRISTVRCYEILWPVMMQLVAPFCKVIASIHHLWSVYEEKNQHLLDKLCHPFYQQYLFGEYPSHYIFMICFDQSKMLPVDKYRTLLKQWDRQNPPSPDLIGYFMHHRIWILYSQSIILVNTALELMLFFYTIRPESESAIEDFISTNNSLICSDMKFMPLFVYRDLIRSYFQCLANFSPRIEKFLTKSGCIETLIQFIEFMYCKLDENFNALQQEKNICTSNSDPRIANHLKIKPISVKDDPRNYLEIVIEATINSISFDFVALLNSIFSKQKNIDHITKNESITNEIDEEMGDVEQQQQQQHQQAKDDELDINENDNMRESIINDDENDKYNEEGLLSKFIMTLNPKPLVMAVTGCLLWPNSNMKLQICNVNQKLIQSLISRQMINSIQAFFDLAIRLLQSIMLTKRSDTDILNRLVNLLFLIYEKIVIKNNLTEIVNGKLSQICKSDLNEWNRFSNSLLQKNNNASQIKKAQKMLRNLVESTSLEELSSTHSMKKPNVICLGMLQTDKDNNVCEDINTGFLSWL